MDKKSDQPIPKKISFKIDFPSYNILSRTSIEYEYYFRVNPLDVTGGVVLFDDLKNPLSLTSLLSLGKNTEEFKTFQLLLMEVYIHLYIHIIIIISSIRRLIHIRRFT